VDNGTIVAGNKGILVSSGGVVTGGIQVSSKGTISARSSGIVVENTATFGGGIDNSGTVSGANSAITVRFANEFAGSITNSGVVGDIAASNVAIFYGGITNRGKLGTSGGNGPGIRLQFVGTFAGAITNTGVISGKSGIHTWVTMRWAIRLPAPPL
jgi:hypothetical protein